LCAVCCVCRLQAHRARPRVSDPHQPGRCHLASGQPERDCWAGHLDGDTATCMVPAAAFLLELAQILLPQIFIDSVVYGAIITNRCSLQCITSSTCRLCWSPDPTANWHLIDITRQCHSPPWHTELSTRPILLFWLRSLLPRVQPCNGCSVAAVRPVTPVLVQHSRLG
jgi:hypothetical protein